MRGTFTYLDHQLARLRRRLLLRAVMRSAAVFVICVLPPTLALIGLDYALRFSHAGRLAELIALSSWTATVAGRCLLEIARQPRSAERLALHVERLDPGYCGRLVSRVEFRSKRDGHTSRNLAEAMCRQVESQASSLDPQHIVSFHPAGRPLIAALVLLFIAAVWAARNPSAASMWLQRTEHPLADIHWPPQTHITGLDTHYRVRVGDSLKLAGRVAGRIPSTGTLERWPAAAGQTPGASGRVSVLSIAPDGSFAATIGPLLEATAIRIQAGDAQIPCIIVEVVVPPSLASFEATYHYPDFLGRPPQSTTVRDIRALVGTRVELRLTTDKPVERMTLTVASPAGERNEPIPLVSATQGVASLVVRAPGWYSVRLEGKDGIATDDPPTYAIVPIENHYPSVVLRQPQAESTVTPLTKVPVVFEAQDDFGVTGAALVWQRRQAAASSPSPPVRTAIPIRTGQRAIEVHYLWDLAGTGVQPGDDLSFYLEVEDAGEHSPSGSQGPPARPAGTLKVVDIATYLRQHQAALRAAFDEIDRLAAESSAAWDELSGILHLLDRAGPSETRPRLQILRDGHQRHSRQTQALADRLGALAADWSNNLPSDQSIPQGTKALAEALANLAAGPARDAEANLETALASWPTGQAAPRGVRRACEQAHGALGTMVRLLARLSAARPFGGTRQPAPKDDQRLTSSDADFGDMQKTLQKSLSKLPRPNAPAKTPGKETEARKLQADRPENSRKAAVAGSRGGGPAAREVVVQPGRADNMSMTRPSDADRVIAAWQWNLPEQARQVIRQSMAEPFPPQYAAAIRRYYERLGQQVVNQP